MEPSLKSQNLKYQLFHSKIQILRDNLYLYLFRDFRIGRVVKVIRIGVCVPGRLPFSNTRPLYDIPYHNQKIFWLINVKKNCLHQQSSVGASVSLVNFRDS